MVLYLRHLSTTLHTFLSNHRKHNTLQTITFKCSRHGELGEGICTRFSSPNSLSTKIISTNYNMGLDHESTSKLFSITKEESISRLSLLPKQRHSHMKRGFTPTPPLHNSTYCILSNHRKHTTLKPTTTISYTVNWEKRVARGSIPPALSQLKYNIYK